MRFVDGMTAAEEIRRMDSEVMIIFITNMAQYAIRGYEVGALDYILKPVGKDVLLQTLSRVSKQKERVERKEADYKKMELDYMEIGRNIRRCRRERGLKQKDLAEMVRVSDQHMSHIENGSTQLSLPTLIAIANALAIDCNTLLGQTLGKAQGIIMRQELAQVLDSVGGDERKLRLRVELCRLLEQYDQ